MRSWWVEGVGSRIAFVFTVDICPAYFYAVVAAALCVTCADPLLGSPLVDTVLLRWVLLHCRVPFSENVGFWVAEMLPAVGVVSISGGWAAVPDIAVLGPLGLPVIAAGGALVVHSCSCSVAVSLSDVLASARDVVVGYASR